MRDMKRVESSSGKMPRRRWLLAGGCAGVLFAQTAALTQGRGGATWTTTAGDAGRTASVKNDPKITTQSVAKDFKLLWKQKLSGPSASPESLTQPVLLPNIISFKGFKALAFVGGSDNNVYAIDYDLSRLFWSRHLTTTGAAPRAATAACPGGLATITRATPLSQQAAVGRGGRGAQPGGGGRGAPQSSPPMPGSGPGPNAVLGGVGGRGSNNNVYAITSDGRLHALNAQDGSDMVPPIAFLPANAKAVGSILIDTVLYAATADACGGAANALWAIELANDANTVRSWPAGAIIAGDGPAFGPDGTIYIATGAGDSSASGSANSIVALDPKTLEPKATFKPDTPAPFTTSPIVFQSAGRTFVAAASTDGRVHMLDGAAALVSSSAAAGVITGLATWEESRETWIAASVNGPTSNGSVVAFKLTDDGKPAMKQAWASRDLTAPTTPLVINAVVFALSSGHARSPQRSKAAVLYALDAATGKELWNSAGAITSSVRLVGPSGGDGQVYVVTADGTLYAFGIPVER
jgi:outer membrane protein assembly factor BamB